MKSAWGFASSMDGFRCKLDDILYTIQVFDENFEEEAYQPSDKIEEWKAINFVQRSPVFLSMLRVIQRDLSRIIEEIKAEVDSICEEHRKEVLHEEQRAER